MPRGDGALILGISAFYHDSAAALLRDGVVVAAAQEERFSRKKNDADFPGQAVRYCLAEAGASVADLTHVVFYDKPFSKLERLLETFLAVAPTGLRGFLRALPAWLGEKLWIDRIIQAETGYEGDIFYAEHHESHAASAFYPSPFDAATVLTLDGVGEWATSSVAHGRDNQLEFLAELRFPHSLGLLYSAFTAYCGFRVNSGEYKLMGLAPYGEPRYAQRILDELVALRDDGSFQLNLDYFDFHRGTRMTNRRFAALFDGPARAVGSPLTVRHADVARSIQQVLEEIVLRMVRYWIGETGERRVCLAGGVALNCVANGKLLRSGLVDDVWIQPAAGDAGGALGAALALWHRYLEAPRSPCAGEELQRGSRLGPAFDNDEVQAYLDRIGAPYELLGEGELPARIAQLLAGGNVVGWHQGRMEFGPRALGGRSILADPRDAGMQKRLNLKIKQRESFRPFAPAILADRVGDYFELDRPSPYMLLVAEVRPEQRRHLGADEQALTGFERLRVARSTIPAVTHVDDSARVQTVDGRWHPRFHALLRAFDALTGCPVLVNTSFNMRDEPIVCSPEDSYRCFCRTQMDYLVLERCLLRRQDQPPGNLSVGAGTRMADSE